MPNIAIVWDFDGTLSPDDSTTKVVEFLDPGRSGAEFWKYVKGLRGDQVRPKWEHVLAMDAPIWMYALSRIASKRRVPLNSEFFELVKPRISLYSGVPSFLKKLRLLQERRLFKDVNLTIHFFVVTAGLKHLVELLFPPKLITWTFGCRYEVVAVQGSEDEPESIPVFCMDETMKTRSLFEISKGAFQDSSITVNTRVTRENLWAPFENMVYIGDGDTDVPALSLVRSHGGLGIAVYNPETSKAAVDRRLSGLRLNKRSDLITPADFSEDSELFNYLTFRCRQIALRYQAELAA
jgi:hypothetical protein